MRDGLSIKTLRAWLAVSALFCLLTGAIFAYLLFSGQTGVLTTVSAGCAFVAAGLNACNICVQYRRRRRQPTE